MNNTLPLVVKINQSHASLFCIGAQGRNLHCALSVRDVRVAVWRCWDVVVLDRDVALAGSQDPSRHGQSGKSLRAGDFMHKMPVNVDKVFAVFITGDHMGLPDLVEQGAHWILTLCGCNSCWLRRT